MAVLGGNSHGATAVGKFDEALLCRSMSFAVLSALPSFSPPSSPVWFFRRTPPEA
jgi:hypothetical protein